MLFPVASPWPSDERLFWFALRYVSIHVNSNPAQRRFDMSDATYKVTEVVGTSTESIQKAVRNGIARASKTLHGLNRFEVTEIRGHIVDGDVGHFQVTMKIGFKMEG